MNAHPFGLGKSQTCSGDQFPGYSFLLLRTRPLPLLPPVAAKGKIGMPGIKNCGNMDIGGKGSSCRPRSPPLLVPVLLLVGHGRDDRCGAVQDVETGFDTADVSRPVRGMDLLDAVHDEVFQRPPVGHRRAERVGALVLQ